MTIAEGRNLTLNRMAWKCLLTNEVALSIFDDGGSDGDDEFVVVFFCILFR